MGYNERRPVSIQRFVRRSVVAAMCVTGVIGWSLGTTEIASAADSLTASDRQAILSFADQYEAAFASAKADPKSAASLLAPVAEKKLIADLKKNYFSVLVKKGETFTLRSSQTGGKTIQSGSTSNGRAVAVWCTAAVEDFYLKGELIDSGTNVIETTAEVRKYGRRWLMYTFTLASNSSCANSLDQPELRPDVLAVPARYQSATLEANKNPGAAALLLPAALASPALEQQLAVFRKMATNGEKWVGTDDDGQVLNPQIEDPIVAEKGVTRVTYCSVTGGYVVDKNGKAIPETVGTGVDEIRLSVAKYDRVWKVIAIGRLNTNFGKSDCNVPGGAPKKKK
jgi:hypothetical protein